MVTLKDHQLCEEPMGSFCLQTQVVGIGRLLGGCLGMASKGRPPLKVTEKAPSFDTAGDKTTSLWSVLTPGSPHSPCMPGTNAQTFPVSASWPP
jgi:hypothetical protein